MLTWMSVKGLTHGGWGGGVSWEFTGLRKIRSDFTGLSPKSAAGEIFTGIFVFLRSAEAKNEQI